MMSRLRCKRQAGVRSSSLESGEGEICDEAGERAVESRAKRRGQTF